MFDVAPTEFLFVAVLALLVIGPKDLPRVMRVVGGWVGKARATARHFRSGFDDMMREAELAEMEKKWQEENARIMQQFPTALTDDDGQTIADATTPPGAETGTGPVAPSPKPEAGTA